MRDAYYRHAVNKVIATTIAGMGGTHLTITLIPFGNRGGKNVRR